MILIREAKFYKARSADDDLVPIEIDILDAELETLLQAQARPV
jgi:hypothetical protein